MKQEENKLAIFEGRKIRRVYDEKQEKWYFSVVDVISVLIEQPDFKKAKSYWTTLKNRLKQEGSQLVTKCDQLKMQSADGKFYKTDAADTETLLRLIQSVPSKKAELIFTALAEMSTRQIAETFGAKGLEENKVPAKKGGRIAKNARLELEEKTGKKVVSGKNFKALRSRKKLKG